MLMVAVLSWLFVWRVVDQPIKALKTAPNILSEGQARVPDRGAIQDEVGEPGSTPSMA
jgi:hypothetical protein